MGTEYVTLREFDNFAQANAEQMQTIWTAIEKQTTANAATSENVAVLSEQMGQAAAVLKKRDARAWALTLAFAVAIITASIPYVVKGLNVLLGVDIP
jgi:hypothetical protein